MLISYTFIVIKCISVLHLLSRDLKYQWHTHAIIILNNAMSKCFKHSFIPALYLYGVCDCWSICHCIVWPSGTEQFITDYDRRLRARFSSLSCSSDNLIDLHSIHSVCDFSNLLFKEVKLVREITGIHALCQLVNKAAQEMQVA